MTREQQKAYNAENYPASVLTWLNEVIDMAYDDFESRTCKSCKYYDGSHACLNENSIAYGTINRVYEYDGCITEWESKDD